MELCKTALYHTAEKQLKIFFETNTPDFINSEEWTLHSPDMILVYSLRIRAII